MLSIHNVIYARQQVPEQFWRKRYSPTWDPLRVRMEPRIDPDAPEEAEDAEARRLFGRVPFDPTDAWGTASKVRTPRRTGLANPGPSKTALGLVSACGHRRCRGEGR